VTHLRKMMLEEFQRRHYAETTIGSYIRIVEDFSRRFQRPPDRLGPKHIREYQAELFTKRKFAASTVTVYLAALRFLYTKTLKRVWSSRNSLSEKGICTAHGLEPGRSCTTHRRGTYSLPSHVADDPLRHGTPACRTGPSKSHRHRQPAHGRSRSGWQGSQRSRCHAEPQAARRVPQALAPVKERASDKALRLLGSQPFSLDKILLSRFIAKPRGPKRFAR
jgi:Phage integrase, N-terminal SAM-like domain